jgi:hypothetical protein
MPRPQLYWNSLFNEGNDFKLRGVIIKQTDVNKIYINVAVKNTLFAYHRL